VQLLGCDSGTRGKNGATTENFAGIGSTSGIEWWRKDLRSIPKVFLIDAYEVS
jgi:hypothetical protein